MPILSDTSTVREGTDKQIVWQKAQSITDKGGVIMKHEIMEENVILYLEGSISSSNAESVQEKIDEGR